MLHNSLIIFFQIQCPTSSPQTQNTHTELPPAPRAPVSVIQSGRIHSIAYSVQVIKFFLIGHKIFCISALENTWSLMQIKNYKETGFGGKMAQT